MGAQICSNSSTMHFFFLSSFGREELIRLQYIHPHRGLQIPSEEQQGEGEGCNGFEKREVLGLGIKWGEGGGLGGSGNVNLNNHYLYQSQYIVWTNKGHKHPKCTTAMLLVIQTVKPT